MLPDDRWVEVAEGVEEQGSVGRGLQNGLPGQYWTENLKTPSFAGTGHAYNSGTAFSAKMGQAETSGMALLLIYLCVVFNSVLPALSRHGQKGSL